MKLPYIIPVVVAAVTLSAGVGLVSADTGDWNTPEQVRQNVTRSSDATTRPSRERSTPRGQETETPSDDGTGTVINVSYNGDDELVIEYGTNGDGGTADISITINGDVVNDTGGQNTGGNGSTDGQDGADGTDGNGGNDDDEEEVEEDDEEEVDDSGRREGRERDTSSRDNRDPREARR